MWKSWIMLGSCQLSDWSLWFLYFHSCFVMCGGDAMGFGVPFGGKEGVYSDDLLVIQARTVTFQTGYRGTELEIGHVLR